MNISLDAILKRRSVRSYVCAPILGKQRQDVHKILDKENKGPFGSKPRFSLIDRQEYVTKDMSLGTYGFIKGARNYIVGAISENTKENLVDYGYVLEKKILAFTDLDLGTCWIGGTFKRKDFGEIISLENGEIIPAITPLGRGCSKSLFEKLIRRIAKAAKRKNFEHLFFDGNLSTPIQVETTGKEFLPLKYVQKAPSADNHQPWRIIRKDNHYHFFLKRTKIIEEAMSTIDLQMVDMGIAMVHFELGAMNEGLYGRWKSCDALPDHGDLEYLMSWEVF